MNVVILRGALSRPPELRRLPSGEELVAYDVRVVRPDVRAETVRPDGRAETVRPDRRAETVPVVWFDAPAAAARLEAGAEVVVVGRVRRRFFRVGGATQSRTEVVAGGVVSRRRAKAAARLVEGALEVAEALATDLRPARASGPSVQ